MARYFFHLRDGTDDVLDEEGMEFATNDLMRKAAMRCARDILGDDIRRGVIDLRFRIEAEDAVGEIIYSLPFKSTFSIVPEAT